MNENSVITKTRRRKLCMAASDPEKPLAVITLWPSAAEA